MVDQTETVELSLDDKEMFRGAMAEPEKVETEPERAERERDEKGRFVARTEEKTEQVKAEEKPEVTEPVKTEVKTEPKDDQSGNVPSWRLREVSEARQAAERKAEEEARQRWQLQQKLDDYERRLSQLQKPKEDPINIFENPEGAFKQQLSPIEAQLAEMRSEMRLATSRALQVATHGAKAVQEMEAAVEKAAQNGNPELQMLRAQMLASHDPVGVAMQWHSRAKVMEVTGGDPEKYKASIRDELLKDPEFRKQVLELTRSEATSRPDIQLPPSLSRVGTAASNEVGDAGDMSSGALFSDAMSHRRARR